MTETVLFEDERRVARTEAAEYLRTVADRLEADGDLTLERGGDSVAIEVPPDVEFEVKVEREGPADGVGELALELELEWPEDASGEGASGDDSLSIQ